MFLVSRYVLDGSDLFVTAVLAADFLAFYLLAICSMGLDDHDRTVIKMIKTAAAVGLTLMMITR